MKFQIFYSWQSDTYKKTNLGLIESSIKLALSHHVKKDHYDVEWNLDRDTQGVPGTVDIVDTIFNKIRHSHVFVGDITLINNNSEGKKTPNPNVLLELGFAAASEIGWENIICVYNQAYGRIEDLPFDLRPRRILPYNLPEDADNNSIKREKTRLAKALGSIFNMLDPLEMESREMFKLAYSGESKNTVRLVLDQPRAWVEKLILELLSLKIAPINLSMANWPKSIVQAVNETIEGYKQGLFETAQSDFKEKKTISVSVKPKVSNDKISEILKNWYLKNPPKDF